MRISDWSSDVCSSDLVLYDPGCGLAEDIRTLDRKVHALDLPRVVGGETREQQHADRADGECHGVRLQEQVDHHRDQQTDDAHDENRSDRREIPLRLLAEVADAGECSFVRITVLPDLLPRLYDES